MSDSIVLCLGHDSHDKPNGCEKAHECQRHLALREKQFPEYDTIVGCACTKRGFPLFIQAKKTNS